MECLLLRASRASPFLERLRSGLGERLRLSRASLLEELTSGVEDRLLPRLSRVLSSLLRGGTFGLRERRLLSRERSSLAGLVSGLRDRLYLDRESSFLGCLLSGVGDRLFLLPELSFLGGLTSGLGDRLCLSRESSFLDDLTSRLEDRFLFRDSTFLFILFSESGDRPRLSLDFLFTGVESLSLDPSRSELSFRDLFLCFLDFLLRLAPSLESSLSSPS